VQIPLGHYSYLLVAQTAFDKTADRFMAKVVES
jgi:hypothetical protein